MLRSSCLARMSPPKHTLFTFRTKVRTVRLSFLATRYNFQASSWLSKKPSCMKILLNVRMRPAAIALNYSVENIRNDVRQKIIIIIIYEKSQFDSLVWGSLTLAPIKMSKWPSVVYPCSIARSAHQLCNAIDNRSWLPRDHTRHVIVMQYADTAYAEILQE